MQRQNRLSAPGWRRCGSTVCSPYDCACADEFTGAVRRHQTTELRNTGMLRLRRQNRLCSRTVSDTANRLLKRTDSEGSSSAAEEKFSAVPLFRSGHMSVICARLGSKGKVGVQRGRETAGVPSFLPPPRGAARSRRPQTANPPAEVQRKTPRPERANTPAAVRVPRSAGAEKEPPVRGEHANAVRVPRSAGAEKKSPGGQCRKRCRFITIKN